MNATLDIIRMQRAITRFRRAQKAAAIIGDGDVATWFVRSWWVQ